ncbi:MAG TPA: conjugative transposon protein TraM [Puia sp.]|jgi:hypothetical protein
MDAYQSRAERQRRLLLIVPLVVVPVVTLYVWVLLAGGRMGVSGGPIAGGFDLTLPGVHLIEEKGLDKMAYYKKAEADSIRREKKQPNGKMEMPGMDSIHAEGAGPGVERIKLKLAELKALVNRGGTENGRPGEAGSRQVAEAPLPPVVAPTYKREPTITGLEIDRLERLIRETQAVPDQGMQELNKTLEKLAAVQQPKVLGDSFVRKPEAAEALPVSAASLGEVINSWKAPSPNGNRFYDLETSGGKEESGSGSMIEAMIPETQTIMNGSLLRLELRTELVINGDRIPPGTALFGVTQLNNERLFVNVSVIRYREKLYPVALQVVDQDGLAGIYEPGSTTRDAARESTGQSIGSIGPGSFDPSVGGQAANAGIQLARSLAGRKVRQVQVAVKTGYRVFLEDVSHKH